MGLECFLSQPLFGNVLHFLVWCSSAFYFRFEEQFSYPIYFFFLPWDIFPISPISMLLLSVKFKLLWCCEAESSFTATLSWVVGLQSCWLITPEVLHVAGRCAVNYPASCTCMINENPFSTLRSSAPPVAISLLELCTKGRKEERRCENLKERSLWLKKKGDKSKQLCLLPGLARCLLICWGTALFCQLPHTSGRVRA